jgi:osmotically-inducible protein OsmY
MKRGVKTMVTRSTELADRVSQALMDDERTREALIDVVNNQGVVTLSGVVKSHEMRDVAEQIVRQQQGVITVVNDLKIA